MHTTTGGRALETRLARSLCGSVLCSKRESSSPFISISQNALRNRIAAAEVDPPKQQFGYFDVFWFCFDPGLDGTKIQAFCPSDWRWAEIRWKKVRELGFLSSSAGEHNSPTD